MDKKVHREFPDWFAQRILNDNNPHAPDMINLATGPLDHVRRYTAYNVNGFKFCTIARDEGSLTQNSGVFGTFGTRSYASSRDTDMRFGGVSYYGKLVDIIELNYQGHFTVPLFNCMWADTRTSRGITLDILGITSVNFSRLIHTGEMADDEPYILASQAQQVYYVEDRTHKDWHMVIHMKPRDLYDMGDEDDLELGSQHFEPENFDNLISEEDGHLQVVR